MNTFEGKEILVIGGAGFIGSHLVESLMMVGARVQVVDNYLTGSEKNHIPGASYIRCCASEVLEFFGAAHLDYIFHFGEYSRVEQSFVEPELALANTVSTIPQVLELWRITGAKLIYSGSSTKFSANGAGRTLSPYTMGKAINSELIPVYAEWYKLSYAVVYFYNVYGGREISEGKYATVVAKFLKSKRDGASAVSVVSPGTQRRNFTHIEDIVSGLVCVAEAGEGDGFGIGSPESYSVMDICRFLSLNHEFLPEHPANRSSGPLETDKTSNLGWRAVHRLPDYLERELKKF